MKKIFFLAIMLLFLQCSGNEPEIPVIEPPMFDYNDFVETVKSAPRVDIPKDSLPVWLVEYINYFEKYFDPDLGYYAQIAFGEISYEPVYYIHCTYQSTMGGDFFDKEGNTFFYPGRYVFHTSNKWVVIFELGNVPYPRVI